jgi:DNA-binding transcriptional MerR regulator
MAPARNSRDYLTVKGAAAVRGAGVKTLHNWDRAGELRPARQPLNRYRPYRRRDLQALLRRLQPPGGGEVAHGN